MITLHVDLGRLWRGGQSQALLLMKGLRARGHRTELVTLRGSPLALRAEAEGIRVHTVAASASRARAAMRIAHLVAEMKAEVVHAHEAHAVTAVWLARISGKATVAVSRRLAYPIGRNRISRAKYRSAARILAVSKFVAESVAASGIPSRQIAVVYDGVELPPPVSRKERLRARRRWGLEENSPLLGCVGYLLPEKNQELLVRAWPAIRKSCGDCRLLIAGDGPCRSKWQKLALELGAQNSIHFAGHVENIAEVYAALDIFLFPSHAEPLGSSMLAALAYGLPTVALARGAVPEVIVDGRNGLLASRPEPAEFAATVNRLLDDAALAERLGAAGRATIQERFTADRMVDETLRVYEGARRQESRAGGTDQ